MSRLLLDVVKGNNVARVVVEMLWRGTKSSGLLLRYCEEEQSYLRCCGDIGKGKVV